VVSEAVSSEEVITAEIAEDTLAEEEDKAVGTAVVEYFAINEAVGV
jgi:hypothetical protein